MECPCRSEKHHDHTFAEPEIYHEQGHLRITSTKPAIEPPWHLEPKEKWKKNIPADTFEF